VGDSELQVQLRSPDVLALPVVNRPIPYWRGFFRDIGEMWRHRDLVRALTGREFRVRYKGAKLGWLWSLARPLVMLAVYGLAIGVFLGAGKYLPDFVVYLFVGLTGWGFFAQIVSGSVLALTNNTDLIKKVYFPREILILAVVVTAFVDLLIQYLVLLVAYILNGHWPIPSSLWWLIPALLVSALFGVSLGLVLAAENARLKDIGYLTEVFLQVGFWLVPVVYSYSLVAKALVNYPILDWVYLANPMTNALFAFRNALWPPASGKAGSDFAFEGDLGLRLLVLIVIGIAALVLSQRFFARRAANFAQEL
jgi:ABC-2 type transport system permease protein